MITDHLAALQVVIPLLAAPLCILAMRGGLAWLITLVASAAALSISVLLFLQVSKEGPTIYALGGWAAPWGIEYRIDILSVYLLLIVSGIALVCACYSYASVAREMPAEKRALFYALYLLFLAGMLGVIVTGDVFNLFVFVEISSLASYGLVSMGKDRRALFSAFQYLVLGTIGATFLLIGIGFLYSLTGTLNMADLAERIPQIEASRTLITAFAFITVGVGLKLALFPLHFWLPDAYSYAPSTVSAFMAATSTKVFVYVLLRFIFSVFGATFVFDEMHFSRLLIPLALAGAIVGSAMAIFQNNVKKLLAWSSVAQIGYIVLGIGIASLAGLTAGIVHVFNHALIKCSLFLALGCFYYRLDSVRVDDLRGIGRSMPWTASAFVLGGLCIIGVPLTNGFISKWSLVEAALDAESGFIAILILLSSLLAVVYMWRVFEAMWMQSGNSETSDCSVTEAPLSMLLPLWALVAANIYFGIDTSFSLGYAARIAEFLRGIGS